VTRVFDVAEELVDGHLRAGLVERDPVDGVGQRLGEADSPAGQVPQAVARAADPTGQQHAQF